MTILLLAPTHAIEAGLTLAAQSLRLLLEALSVGTVFLGLVLTLKQGISRWSRRRGGSPSSQMSLRLVFGNWLALALEFQLGADIVATTASPDAQNLIQLSVVAIIRTVLNVFLAREMEEHRQHAKRSQILNTRQAECTASEDLA